MTKVVQTTTTIDFSLRVHTSQYMLPTPGKYTKQNKNIIK